MKVKDKLNNAVFLDSKQYEKIAKEIPKVLSITRSILAEKYKVNGSVARGILKDLHSKGLIRQVGDHHSTFTLYSGVQSKSAADKAAEAAILAEEQARKKAKKW